MFSFFCTRQASKGKKYVCLEKGRRGVTILVPDSRHHRHAKDPDLPQSCWSRGMPEAMGSGLKWALLGKKVLR